VSVISAGLLPGVQANSVADGICFQLDTWVSGLIVAVIFGAIVLVVKRIAKSRSLLFLLWPLDILIVLVIIAIDFDQLPGVIALVLKVHLIWRFWSCIWFRIQWGVKRGIYSNEAGQGTAPHIAAANVSHPTKQGLVQSFRCISIRC
jgi:AGCS family alanine or glycine:cation symporter